MARIPLGTIGPSRLRNPAAPELAGARRTAKRLQGQPIPQARQTAHAEGYLLVLRWCDGACPETGTGHPQELQAAARKGRVVDAWAADDPRSRSHRS